MSTFVENFKEQWAKSFGEDKLVQKPMPHSIYPEDFEMPLEKQTPVGILKRIWNDAILGGDHKSRELETPLLISGARGIGKILGFGAMAAGISASIGAPALASLPLLPLTLAAMGTTALGGAIYGLFTKPKEKEPYERLVHIDRGAGVRSYFMETVQPPAPDMKDKAAHVMHKALAGWEIPLVGLYRAVNTPIRLTGYAAHAFTTAVKAAIETLEEDDTPPPPSPSGNLPAPHNDFTM